MDACDPGHQWQPEHESGSYVRYRCADCGSVCAAPKPAERALLTVDRVPAPPPRMDSAPPPVEVPLWVSAEPPPSSPAAG